MQWAAPMDWMCEEKALAATGLTIPEHQRRTSEGFLQLRQLAPDIPFIPVLQGDTVGDYLRHADQYVAAGVDLLEAPLVGLGSVCRRQSTDAVVAIVSALQPLRLHGFGVKSAGIARMADLLTSSDSLAWSSTARLGKIRLPGCPHRTCANCMRWAFKWREKVLTSSLFVE